MCTETEYTVIEGEYMNDYFVNVNMEIYIILSKLTTTYINIHTHNIEKNTHIYV